MNDELMLIMSFIPDLKPRGDEFVALCPFHAETRPSFHINLEKRLFYCFGCGIGGTFDTLFRMLKIKPEQQSDVKTTQTIHAVLASAQKFFREQLRLNQNVREILKRQNRELFVDRFGLGFAPNDNDALRNFLREQGFSDDLLVQSGLFAESLYPILRGRVTIPIKSVDGRIIAFAGRALDDKQNPKYINTRNSPMFNKSTSLYLAETALALAELSPKPIYIVEGYFDAMALNYMQFPAVAIMGAKLTTAQALLLKGLLAKIRAKTQAKEKKLVILLDSDEAGLRAAVETAAHLIALDIPFEVGLLPKGHDPEEIAMKNEMSKIKMLRPIQAVVALIAQLKIDAKRAAKLLLELPLEYRQQAFKILRLIGMGEAYLRLLSSFMRQTQIREFRKATLKLSIDEMIVASVLQGKISVSQLPESYIDILPKDLDLILRSIAEGKPFPPSVEALAARLSFQKVFIDQDNLLQAALSKVLKREALNALLQAKSADASELPNLRRKFIEAQQALDSLRAVSTDELL